MKFIFDKFKIFNIKPGKIKKIPWFLGLNAFWIILFLIFIELVAGAFLFYKYAFLAVRYEPKIIDSDFKFKSNIYQSVLKEWQEKNQKFEEEKTEQYSNPFIATKIKEASNSINSKLDNPVIK